MRSAAGQICKSFGAKVIGLAGSDSKCRLCVDKYGYDAMINYKTMEVGAELEKHKPFHGFYDNTGGPSAAEIKARLVDGAHIAKVGSIAGADGYVEDARFTIASFYAGGCVDKWPGAIKAMAGLIADGKLKFDETILNGIDQYPHAMLGLMAGRNEGKMLVQV